jgi:hypothetical protein
VALSADNVLDCRLEGTLGPGAQLTEVGQDGVASLLGPGQDATASGVPGRVFPEQLAQRGQLSGIEGLIPTPDHFGVLCSAHVGYLTVILVGRWTP